MKRKKFISKIHSMEQIQLIEKCYETISNMLIDYIKNVVKMPKELYDNSCIGKHPDYLKFKEDYVKERTANRKRQRRKNIGDDTQGQGQSGSGYETSLGESTIVLE